MPNYEHKAGRIPVRVGTLIDGVASITMAGDGPVVGYVEYEIIGATACGTCGFDSMVHAYIGTELHSGCDRCAAD